MAILIDPVHQTPFHLRAQTLVGRSRSADLRLQEPAASGQHALIRWVSGGWELRDLGSRNGTSLDGRLLVAGERVRLRRGSRLSFGTAELQWLLSHNGPPVATAICGQEEVCAEGGMLCLPPQSEHPEVTIYNDRAGRWVFERDGQTSPAPDALQIGARRWILHLPEVVESTCASEVAGLEASSLCFEVTADEETVKLDVVLAGQVRHLAERSHHYLLLTLARRRLEDRREGCAPDEEGWLYREQLADDLRMDASHINVLIHRARRQLANAGLEDAARIVERRSQAGQLRLGVGDIEIVRL